MVAYAALLLAGIQLSRVSADALFIVGGSALLLVFIGIHNAWDTVTYVMLERARERKAKAAAKRPNDLPPREAHQQRVRTSSHRDRRHREIPELAGLPVRTVSVANPGLPW